MNAVEAVVTYTEKNEGKYGAEYYMDDYSYHVAPYFLEVCELFCNEEDAEDLEELRRIYKMEGDDRIEALQEFIVLDQGDNIVREFEGFQYALDVEYHVFSFCAVARMAIDELLARCARLGISMEDLHSRFNVTVSINDVQLLGQIHLLIGAPNELMLEKDKCDIKFGEIKKFDRFYSVSGEVDSFPASKEDIDKIDPETFRFIRENKEPVPEDMVFVKGGEFVMGRKNDLTEFKHTVQLNDFYISRYPVTFDQYDQFCKETGREKPKDNGWGRFNLPVINVSYAGAKDYCLWVTQKTGIRADLPTEAQWEFAARGGTLSKGFKYSGSNDFDEVGWPYSRETDTNFPVGQKKPNELGIHDMSGNIWEWCRDIFSDYFYRMKNPVDPMCNTMGYYNQSENRDYIIRDFFKASINRNESELNAALKSWITSTKEHNMKEDNFEMVVRGGSYTLPNDGPLLLTTRGQYHFLAKNCKVGFRIVMYP